MKSLLVFAIVLAIGIIVSLNCSAQNNYTFEYDGNGNRKSRTLDMSSNLKSTSPDNTEIGKKEYKEVIEDLEIILYPNPTKGEITISLNNFEDQEPSFISVYDYSGRLLQNYNNVQEINLINISDLPRATYLLKIVIGEKSTEWKVIKE
jgi:YD repeat-containing protein